MVCHQDQHCIVLKCYKEEAHIKRNSEKTKNLIFKRNIREIGSSHSKTREETY